MALFDLFSPAGALAATPLGPLAAHMGLHLTAMNGIAPLLALASIACGVRVGAAWRTLGLASALQLALLWLWHAPAFETQRPFVVGVMHVSLFAAALIFWLAVFAQRGAARWRAIVALAITGKLACLLGALLLFAPRPLYGGDPLSEAAALDDQRLAGLMMLIACPLTYGGAGVAIAARWLRDLEARAPASVAFRRMARG